AFPSSGAYLPLPTRIVIGLSQAITRMAIPTVLLCGLLAVVVARAVRSERGRAVADRLLLRVPVFGESLRLAATTRIAATLATLLGAGIPILEALSTA